MMEVDKQGQYFVLGNWEGFPALEIFIEEKERKIIENVLTILPKDAGTTHDPEGLKLPLPDLFPVIGDKGINLSGKVGDNPQHDKEKPLAGVEKNKVLFKKK